MIYRLQKTTQFKKDCKLMKRRGLNLKDLTDIIEMLQNGQPLPPDNRDHDLVGDFVGFRECHIHPDWLLVYYIQHDRLVLVCARTGSHSDLFG